MWEIHQIIHCLLTNWFYNYPSCILEKGNYILLLIETCYYGRRAYYSFYALWISHQPLRHVCHTQSIYTSTTCFKLVFDTLQDYHSSTKIILWSSTNEKIQSYVLIIYNHWLMPKRHGRLLACLYSMFSM